MRNDCAVLLLAVAAAGCQPGADLDDVFGGDTGRWVDLTYTLSAETIYWPTAEAFKLEPVAFGRTEAGYFYAANNFSSAEHGGTHLDAPIHFAEGREAADQIPLDRLIGPAAVVDVSDRSTEDYQVQVQDFNRWEQEHGPLPTGVIVLVRTGWGERWPDRQRYLGTELTGEIAVPELHFPGVSPAAAQWLLDERQIDAIGIDTPSLDFGQSTTFEAHQVLYGANVPGFENVANLQELPAAGSFIVALPMKIGGGSGAPLRMVAFIPASAD